ncbi:unnamed protein product [Arabis nemorensis]|uniref:Uncharacterized protein n=1 Tax=Arabis nemorensis TaxID=586526 RepID=A0A565BFD1_9BRAS|nr:unnamed protein product [Arabis nemorensis]
MAPPRQQGAKLGTEPARMRGHVSGSSSEELRRLWRERGFINIETQLYTTGFHEGEVFRGSSDEFFLGSAEHS